MASPADLTRGLTAEYVRSILDYDPETGFFTWKPRDNLCPAWNGRWIGQRAGRTKSGDYCRIGIDGKPYQAHRLAWFVMTGRWPQQQIDHIDGNKSNNRFANLREADAFENHHNIGRAANNTSGFKGVCFNKRQGYWQATIKLGGKRKFLGFFATPDAAHEAYSAAAEVLHGGFRRVA